MKESDRHPSENTRKLFSILDIKDDLTTSTESRPNYPWQSWVKWDVEASEWDVLWASTAIKLLLFPS